MKIKPFAVEEWMNAYETGAKYNIAETCVDSVSIDELFELCGEDKDAFWRGFSSRRMTYGDIEGAPEFKRGICRLYRTVKPEEIVTTHGASGANHHLFYSLLEPGDRVISIVPSYQQLYSIPESYGAQLHLLYLEAGNGYQPDLEQLRALAVPGTRLICLSNPNNPTGALMGPDTLREIVEIAGNAGAYVLCDEVYRHLTQDDGWSESIVDLYDKGISVSSMSKVFSLAGLRLGWIATHDAALVKDLLSHRDYNLISCGMFDEALAAVALAHSDRLLARSRGIVRRNLALLSAWVDSQPHISFVRPQAGTTALVAYDFDMPSVEFCTRLYRETGAFVTPGDCFDEPKCFRIGYASDTDTLEAGLNAMADFISKLEKEGA